MQETNYIQSSNLFEQILQQDEIIFDKTSGGKNQSSIHSQKKKRVFFTKEEDEKLKELVNKYGTRKWSLISSLMNNRTSRQCRDRYFNYLFPGCFKGEWSNDQDNLLVNLYMQYGPKWSFFSKNFPGRTPNSLKNRWNYFLSKKILFPEKNESKVILKEKIIQDELSSIYDDDFAKLNDFLSFNDEYQFLQ